MVRAQEEEVWIKEIKSHMLNHPPIKDQIAFLLINQYWGNRFFIDNDLLWTRLNYRGEQARVCLVIPRSKVNNILKDGHGTLFTGHEGVAKTRFRITQNYWWPSIDKDTGNFIKSCEKCQKTRVDIHPTCDVKMSLPLCTEPNQRILADLFEDLKTTSKNNKCILVMTDAFTKYVKVVTLPNKEANTIADPMFHTGCVDTECQ